MGLEKIRIYRRLLELVGVIENMSETYYNVDTIFLFNPRNCYYISIRRFSKLKLGKIYAIYYTSKLGAPRIMEQFKLGDPAILNSLARPCFKANK